MRNRGAWAITLGALALLAPSCTVDDVDDTPGGGQAGSPAAGSAGDLGGGTSGHAGSGGTTAGTLSGSDGGAGAGTSPEGGSGEVAVGGEGGTAGATTNGGSENPGGAPNAGAAGEGGSADEFGCTDDEFPLLGSPSSCVACGSYHYTAYEPVYYDVCEVYGTEKFYDRAAHKLYLEAKPGFPAPAGWSILRDVGETSDYVYVDSYAAGCTDLVCIPPDPPACAANAFPIHLSVSGKYLVADLTEAAACVAATSVPMMGRFDWGRIDYGCAGAVTTRIAVDFSMNADDATDFVGISCLAGDGLEPKKVDGPPP